MEEATSSSEISHRSVRELGALLLSEELFAVQPGCVVCAAILFEETQAVTETSRS